MAKISKYSDNRQLIKYVSTQVDIIEIVRRTMGDPIIEVSNNAKWICPFHKDTDPSFTVSKDKQFFYCFGCKETGNVVGFIAKYNNLPISVAVDLLIESNNIDVTQYRRQLTSDEKKLFRYIEINKIAQKYFVDNLRSEIARKELSHLVIDRSINLETINEYGLGYSPSVEELVSFLEGSGVSRDEILNLQFMYPYMFNTSVTYPMCDINGDVYFYYTRNHLIKDSQYYSNDDKHPLFKQILPLFGIQVRSRSNRNRNIHIVEGQIDALSLYQAIEQDTIATCGVSKFNYDVVNYVMSLGYENVVFIPDGDEAGRSAIDRISRDSHFIGDNDLRLKVVVLPDDLDPNDLIKTTLGNLLLIDSVNHATSVSQYVISNEYTGDSPDEIGNLVHRLGEFAPRLRLMAYTALAKVSGIDINHLLDLGKTHELSDIMPRNLEANLLYTMIKSGDFSNFNVNPEIFSLQIYRDIYKVIQDLYKDHQYITIDLMTTHLSTSNSELYDRFNSILQTAFEIDIRSTIDILDDMLLRRILYNNMKNITGDVVDPGCSILSIIDDISSVAASIMGTRGIDISESTPEVLVQTLMDTLTRRMASESKMVGIELGDRFRILSRMLSGLQPGNFNAIAALWSAGKTSLALNWAIYMAIERQQPLPVLFISGEMTAQQIGNRILSIVSGVPATSILEGNIDNDQYTAVVKAAKVIENGKLYIAPTNNTLSDWLNLINLYRMKYGCEIVFIDYIQLLVMDKNSRSPFHLQLGDASGELKKRAVKSNDNLIISVVSQLSAQAADQDVQTSFATGFARKIAQDADRYVIVQRLSEQEVVQRGIEKGNRLIIIDKDRITGADGTIIDSIYDTYDYPGMKGTLRMGEVLSWKDSPIGRQNG